jgi:cytochrome P450
LSDNEAAYLAGSVFGAGSDTTASGISISVLAAACYPTEQQRLWEELESVVGRERAPTLMDQDKLPLTMAWVLEVLRWRPITAGGFPHKATRDILWVRSRLFHNLFMLTWHRCLERISDSYWRDDNREHLVNRS